MHNEVMNIVDKRLDTPSISRESNFTENIEEIKKAIREVIKEMGLDTRLQEIEKEISMIKEEIDLVRGSVKVDLGKLGQHSSSLFTETIGADSISSEELILVLGAPRLLKVYRTIKEKFKDREFTAADIAKELKIRDVTARLYLNRLYHFGLLKKYKKCNRSYYSLIEE